MVLCDESSQTLEPMVLNALALATNETVVVCAGDDMQIGPKVYCKQARFHGLGNSIIHRFVEHFKTRYSGPSRGNPLKSPHGAELCRSYRSHPEILRLASDLFYPDVPLISCADRRAVSKLENWVGLPRPGLPIIFVDVRGVSEQPAHGGDPSWYNRFEVMRIMSLLDSLLADHPTVCGDKGSNIAICSGFRLQNSLIRQKLGERFRGKLKKAHVAPVETIQGQERDIVIVSTVRTQSELAEDDSAHMLGFMHDPQRLNTAITRSSSLLIIVGDQHALKVDSKWNELIRWCKANRAYIPRESIHPGDDDSAAAAPATSATRPSSSGGQRFNLNGRDGAMTVPSRSGTPPASAPAADVRDLVRFLEGRPLCELRGVDLAQFYDAHPHHRSGGMKVKQMATQHPDWLEWVPGASWKDDKVVLVHRPDRVYFQPAAGAPSHHGPPPMQQGQRPLAQRPTAQMANMQMGGSTGQPSMRGQPPVGQLSRAAPPPGLSAAGTSPTPESWEMLLQSSGMSTTGAALRPTTASIGTSAPPKNDTMPVPATAPGHERRQLQPVGSGASRGAVGASASRDQGSNRLDVGVATAHQFSGSSLPPTMPPLAYAANPHAYPHPRLTAQQPGHVHRQVATSCLLRLPSGHLLVTADAAMAMPFLSLSSQLGGVSIRLCTFGLHCSYTPMAALGAMEIHLVAAAMESGNRGFDGSAVALRTGPDAVFEAKLWVWPPPNHAGVRVITSSADSATLFCPSFM